MSQILVWIPPHVPRKECGSKDLRSYIIVYGLTPGGKNIRRLKSLDWPDTTKKITTPSNERSMDL